MGSPDVERRRTPEITITNIVTGNTWPKFELVAKAINKKRLGEVSVSPAEEQVDTYNHPLPSGAHAVVLTFDSEATKALFGETMNKTEILARQKLGRTATPVQSLSAFRTALHEGLNQAQEIHHIK